MKTIVRWTVGESTKDGYRCLERSINCFLNIYDVDAYICHNCDESKINFIDSSIKRLDQRKNWELKPKGVSWKLYPSRIDINRKEIFIDNDLIVFEAIDQLTQFMNSNSCLGLQDIGRAYGCFDKHVQSNILINSGLFGIPENFNLQKYLDFYVKEWKKNATGQYDKSETFDEQGIVALALTNHHALTMIPNDLIHECRLEYKPNKGVHFVGLNRIDRHLAYKQFQSTQITI